MGLFMKIKRDELAETVKDEDPIQTGDRFFHAA
jgi:hypothetical protein